MTPPVEPKVSQHASTSLAGQKRPLHTEKVTDPTPDDLARMSRSERKRHREMKRRNHITRGFDELTSLLVRIDPDFKYEVEQRELEKQGKSTGKNPDGEGTLPISRVELINHTVTIMERIHHENEQRKQLIAELTGRLRSVTATIAGGQDQVTIMVPTLQPIDPAIHFPPHGRLGMVPPLYAGTLPPSLANVSLAHQASSYCHPQPPAGASGTLGMSVERLARGPNPADVLLSPQRSSFRPSPVGLSGRGGHQMRQFPRPNDHHLERQDQEGQPTLQDQGGPEPFSQTAAAPRPALSEDGKSPR